MFRLSARALVSVILLTLSSAVFAHAHLKTADPAPDAQAATAPHSLRLVFSEQIEPKFSKLTLQDGAGHAVATGPLALDPADAKAVIVPLKDTLKAGTYQVNWHAVSVDTHKSAGSYRFTVK
jgi:methionine-rich copper-binding protein CopC